MLTELCLLTTILKYMYIICMELMRVKFHSSIDNLGLYNGGVREIPERLGWVRLLILYIYIYI